MCGMLFAHAVPINIYSTEVPARYPVPNMLTLLYLCRLMDRARYYDVSGLCFQSSEYKSWESQKLGSPHEWQFATGSLKFIRGRWVFRQLWRGGTLTYITAFYSGPQKQRDDGDREITPATRTLLRIHLRVNGGPVKWNQHLLLWEFGEGTCLQFKFLPVPPLASLRIVKVLVEVGYGYHLSSMGSCSIKASSKDYRHGADVGGGLGIINLEDNL